ncbi:hypothetical protein GDI3004 [Gluconacetobacter diazotrophicus PA1 5]|uniref:Uncharacterized protein n=2 Tax=Gluconacetobacter diazotrophicus TaxID=33996 RepID=A9HRN2_GLUDA|nr:hypothetical protein GDI3004 [Gluconacetobacter diazotrophicus PA1 5]
MFPGDPLRQVPEARATGARLRLQNGFPYLDEIDALLDGDTTQEWRQDPNGCLKMLKARAPDVVDLFIEQAIMAYFSDPIVSHVLTGKATPLFPHHVVMPDIDYDLLEPVLAHG